MKAKFATASALRTKARGVTALAASSKYNVDKLISDMESDAEAAGDATRHRATTAAADTDGFGAVAPAMIKSGFDDLDDPNFFADANNPPTTADKLAMMAAEMKVMGEALSTDASDLTAEEKRTALGDIAEAAVGSIDNAGLSEAETKASFGDVVGPLVSTLNDGGMPSADILAAIDDITQAGAAAFVDCTNLTAADAVGALKDLVQGTVENLDDAGLTGADLTAAVKGAVQGVATEAQDMGLSDNAAEAAAFSENLIEAVNDAGVDVASSDLAAAIGAGMEEGGTSATISDSAESTATTYNPDTSTPNDAAISADAPSEMLQSMALHVGKLQQGKIK